MTLSANTFNVSPSHLKRAAAARRMGEKSAQLCLDFAAAVSNADFPDRAYAFIVSYVRSHSPVPGENVTLACTAAGIKPHDDRAFGAIYAKAIRKGDIRVVGYVPRVRGHGTSGGRLYAAGESA